MRTTGYEATIDSCERTRLNNVQLILTQGGQKLTPEAAAYADQERRLDGIFKNIGIDKS